MYQEKHYHLPDFQIQQSVSSTGAISLEVSVSADVSAGASVPSTFTFLQFLLHLH